MFRASSVHLQEALPYRLLVYVVCVLSWLHYCDRFMVLTFFNQLSNVWIWRWQSSMMWCSVRRSLVGTSSYKPSEDFDTSVCWVKEHPEDGGSRFCWNIFVDYNQLICTVSCVCVYTHIHILCIQFVEIHIMIRSARSNSFADVQQAEMINMYQDVKQNLLLK
jgi:hypothetical protein